MDVGRSFEAEATLRQYGYYRLSGYSHVFRQFKPGAKSPTGRFIEGTRLSDVVDLYRYDEEVRSTLLAALSTIEIALRFHIGHRLGRRAIFGHRDPGQLDEGFTQWRAGYESDSAKISASLHNEWSRDYSVQERRAQETFVSHFRRKYGPHLPVWVATEVMSLGTLSRLYDGLLENDRKLIAYRFGVHTKDGDGDSSMFSNWLNHLRHVRNLCAHHARITNRTFDVAISAPKASVMPELPALDDLASRKLYGTLSIMGFMLARIGGHDNWSQRTVELISRIPATAPLSPSNLGFPDAWATDPVWLPGHIPDVSSRAVADAVDEVDTANLPEAVALVATAKPLPSQGRDWVKYLIKRRALIAHQVGPQRLVPKFQFRNGDIDPLVADVNEALYGSRMTSGLDDAAAAIAVQRWWLTPSGHYPFTRSPLRQLASDPESVRRACNLWCGGVVAILRV